MQAKYKRLRGAMYANSVTQEEIAKLLKRSLAYVSLRMTGKQPYDINEVYAICDYLEIPYGDIYLYFPRGGVDAPYKRSARGNPRETA